MAFAPVFRRVFSPTLDRRAGFGWLLRDDFTTDLPAGSVNGTAAEPGPGTRRVGASAGFTSISSGKLIAIAPHSWSEYFYYSDSIPFAAGRLVVLSAETNSPNEAAFNIGSDSATGFMWPGVRTWGPPAFILSESDLPVNQQVQYVIAYRAAGKFWIVKLPGQQWRLLFCRVDSNPTNLSLTLAAATANIKADFMRVPDVLWLPTPLISDGFGSAFGTSDGLGHAEGIAGGIGSGGGGKVWSNVGGTWSVSGGKAINTPSVSTELCLNGNMETGDPPSSWSYVNATADGVASERTGGSGVQSLQLTTTATGEPYASQNQSLVSGKWFRLSAWAKQTTGSQGVKLRVRDNHVGGYFIETPKVTSSSWTSVVGTGRSSWTSHAIWAMFSNSASIGDVGAFDDISLVQLALSDLLSLISVSCADVFASVNINRGSTAVQCGLAINWDSLTTPANGVIVYCSASVVIVSKCVSGAWSNVSSTSYTYSAGAALVVAKSGTKYRVYYNDAFIVESTISDAGIVNNTLHGLFSTDANNTLDNFVIYPTGTGGEYSYLDQFTS